MLLRLRVENAFSFMDVQELSMVATKLKGNEMGLMPIPGAGGMQSVPVALIYGANASGKTNLVRALTFMRNTVLFSHSRSNPQGGVPRNHFALDSEAKGKPSMFEVEFVISSVRYVFGFTCNDERFISEWLYAFPEGKRRKLYEREGKTVDFGSTMIGAKKTLADFMRDNSLFLSTATQNDHEELTKVANFFYKMEYSGTLAASASTITNTFKENQVDPRTIAFLRSTGTGIIDFEQTEKEVSESVKALTSELIAIAQKHLGENGRLEMDSNRKDVDIQLIHQGRDGHFALPLSDESAGTRRLLLMMSKIFKSLDEGSLVIVDEIDASLHTLVTEQIVELFSDKTYNTKGAQLIATTHDTNVLECDHLRRDQIWFCEKDHNGASHIFSLAEFKLRSTDRFEKGYLDGRFGAIPFAGNLRNIFVEQNK